MMKSKGYGARLAVLVILDIIVINISSLMALFVRFDFSYSAIPEQFLKNVINYAPVNTVLILVGMIICRLYKSIWTYASIYDVIFIICASAWAFVTQVVGMGWIMKLRMPKSYYIIYPVCIMTGFITLRFGYRLIRMTKRVSIKNDERVMIVGAGQAGLMIARELTTSDHVNKKIVCFIDDNVSKKGRYLLGIKIMGGRNDICDIAEKENIDSIYIAIPSLNRAELKELINICSETGKHVKVLPGMYQLE